MHNIRVLREKMGLSQQQVAEAVHVSQQAVARWESGLAKPRADLLPQLASLFNCTIDELFWTPGNKKPPGRGRRGGERMKSYILLHTEKRDVLVTFRQSFWYGIKEVDIFSAPTGQRMFSRTTDVMAKSATSPALARAREAALQKWIWLLEKAKHKLGQ